MKTGMPTSVDIAHAAGVSQSTVSRALRNSSRVRPETRERIIKIAREMNYFVNRTAASLRTHQSRTIVLLLFDESGDDHSEINPFFLAMLGNITRAAANLGYDVLVSFQQLSDDWHSQYEVSNRADGLILLGYGDYISYRPKLTALAKAKAHFIIWGPIIEEQPGHSLGCDNLKGAYEAVSHFAAIGRQRIAFIGHASRHFPELKLRLQGYRKGLRRAGLAEHKELRIDAENSQEAGYRAAKNLIGRGSSFDGVFAVTDQIAIGAMRALHDHGLGVPEDVGVIGFDDLPIAAHVTPALTTVRQDTRTAAQMLVGNLVKLIEGRHVESTLLPAKLIVRKSCGAALR